MTYPGERAGRSRRQQVTITLENRSGFGNSWSPGRKPVFQAFFSVDMAMFGPENSRLGFTEGYPSGQRGQTVNLLAMPS